MSPSLLITGTTLVVAAGIYKLFRRRAPRLTDQDLDEIPGIPPNVRIVQSLGERERTALKEAFLKGTDFKWLVVGDDLSKTDFEDDTNEKIKETREKHKAVTYFMLECVIRFAEMYAHILVFTENPRSDPNPGKTLGVLSLLPPCYKRHFIFTMHFFRAVLPMGRPVTHTMGGGAQERFDAYTSQLHEHHHEVMGDTRHWYVLNLGVFKGTQGKGAGTKLLRAAKAMAGNEALYLECHNDNVAYYKKMGYKHAKQFNFEVEADEGNTSTMPYSYNSMVYE